MASAIPRPAAERKLGLFVLLACASCGDDPVSADPDSALDAATLVDAASAPVDAAVPVDAALEDAAAAMDAAPGRDAADPDDDGGPSEGRERVTLVDHREWRALEKAWDPFEDRPVDVGCNPAAMGFGVEELSLEASFYVRTRLCAYITAEQPSLVDVPAGDLVKVRLWYFQLTSPNGGEAHVAVQLGDEFLIDEHIPIPTDSGGLLRVLWPAPETIPAGTPVRVHIHNHGANEYGLIEVSTGPEE